MYLQNMGALTPKAPGPSTPAGWGPDLSSWVQLLDLTCDCVFHEVYIAKTQWGLILYEIAFD